MTQLDTTTTSTLHYADDTSMLMAERNAVITKDPRKIDLTTSEGFWQAEMITEQLARHLGLERLNVYDVFTA